MGTVLAAQVLQDKSIYNEMELPTGRMSKLKKDDIIAVALGERAALKGFAGHLPKTLKADDVIHLLNFGGIAGVCTSANVLARGKVFYLHMRMREQEPEQFQPGVARDADDGGFDHTAHRLITRSSQSLRGLKAL